MRECAQCIPLGFQIFPSCGPRLLLLVEESRNKVKEEKLRRKEDNLPALS